MKAIRILSIIAGLLGVVGLTLAVIIHMPLIIIYPRSWEGTLIHGLEWTGFCTLFIAGINSISDKKYSEVITNLCSACSFVMFASIIFIGIVTYSWSFSTLLAYIIPCFLSVIIVFDVATKDIKP